MTIGTSNQDRAADALRNDSAQETSTTSAERKETPVGSDERLVTYRTPRIAENRAESIAKAAYCRAQRRGFAPGHELEDWLAAEDEIDQRLAGEGRAY